MRIFIYFLIFTPLFPLNNLYAQNPSEALISEYPNYIVDIKDNEIIWYDSTRTQFCDNSENSFNNLIENPSVKDMFHYEYTSFNFDTPKVNFDPGRIRNQEFLKKMYGATKQEVVANLDTIIWLPSSVAIKLPITKVNGVNKKLQTISNTLDTLPHLHKYINNPAGTFNWRPIAETDRLSPHSFGIAIDINIKYSHYWLWDKRRAGEFNYQNKIPMEIVEIFELNGFIWGGKWYHYDTMHFEYRPELINYSQF